MALFHARAAESPVLPVHQHSFVMPYLVHYLVLIQFNKLSANNEGPNQTAHAQSGLGLHCSKIKIYVFPLPDSILMTLIV